MSSGIVTLLTANGSAELCIECTLEDSATEEGIVTVPIVGRVDSKTADA